MNVTNLSWKQQVRYLILMMIVTCIICDFTEVIKKIMCFSLSEFMLLKVIRSGKMSFCLIFTVNPILMSQTTTTMWACCPTPTNPVQLPWWLGLQLQEWCLLMISVLLANAPIAQMSHRSLNMPKGKKLPQNGGAGQVDWCDLLYSIDPVACIYYIQCGAVITRSIFW